MLPYLCLGAQLLADVLMVCFLSSDTSVVKFLKIRVRVSISLISLSLPLFVVACGFLLASLESFFDSLSLMNPIACRYFLITTTSSQFSNSVGFATHLTNCTMLVGSADV